MLNDLQEEIKVLHASGDVGLLILQKALESASLMHTALVSEVKNQLILLCYHASLDSHNIFFSPEPKKTAKQPKVW